MQEERVAHDIHVFTSELYAQVTAGLVVTGEGCILVDTLPFPEETAQIVSTARAVCPGGVRLIVLTHYHADHVYGTYQFPNATVVSHALTRGILIEKGIDALAEAKSQAPELADVEMVLPAVVFDGSEMTLHLGKKTLQLFHSPGHTPDSIVVYIVEDKVLFAADTMLPVPTIFDGDLETLVKSLERLKELPIESVVQGHGEVILRGEVSSRIDEAVAYLHRIQAIVAETIARGEPRESLQEHDIESCGLSRIPLNGLVQQLHMTNLMSLHDAQTSKEAFVA
jgi:glyoxylase-like metal-dependent hydrolase (beta-lactamase superfamily II)